MHSAVAQARSRAGEDSEWWVSPLRWTSLAVWIGIPIVALVAQPIAGWFVWSVVITALPIFIVLVGYHRWRRICPLAFWNQIMVHLRRPGRRRMSSALEEHYYFVPLALFAIGLWCRLVWSNGDGVAIALLWGILSVVALCVGALFTGKTWCNYICPVSFIEKIYTEPHGLRETPNSQCARCTACKKACPDINQENAYWKEVESLSKRFAYFAFPGLVFGFFLYFWVQAGTWDAFFDGAWSNQPGLWQTAFQPGTDTTTAGAFFLPIVPRAVASFITLVACALASYILFMLVERAAGWSMRRRDPNVDATRVRHIALGLAAFTAFTTFYSFAAQALARQWPWLAVVIGIAVVATATLSLVRRLTRSQNAFAEQALARNIIKRWDWGDTPPPTDLHEAYVIHAARTSERQRANAEVFQAYAGAVRDTLDSGLISRSEVQRLELLRRQLNISNADHDRVMSELAEEERARLADPTKQTSVEKRLQLETYTRALERRLRSTDVSAPDDTFIRQLRDEFGVTVEEHAVLLERLLGHQPEAAFQIAYAIRVIESAAQAIRVFSGISTPANDAFVDAVRRERARTVQRLLSRLTSGADDQDIHDGLCSDRPTRYEAAIEALRRRVPRSIATAHIDERRERVSRLTRPEILLASSTHPSPQVRALALFALSQLRPIDAEFLRQFLDDEHQLVRETARALGNAPVRRSGDDLGMPTINKMIALRSVPIFATLSPEELEQLARSSVETRYAQGRALCIEGEPGDEVFILIEGEVTVVTHSAAGGEIVQVESAGSVIGELAILDRVPRSASVFASSSGVRVLRLSGPAFQRVLNAEHAVAEGVLRSMARRLRQQSSHRPRSANDRLT